MTQRGQLSPEDERRLSEAYDELAAAEATRRAFQAVAVEMVRKSSYREVSRRTGFSTNTLQRWVREAGR